MGNGGPILYGQPVEWGHPLNRGLAAWYLAGPGRGGGCLPDLTGRCPPAVRANAPPWGVMGNGFHWLDLTAASDQYANCGNPVPLQITGQLTVAVRYRLRSLPALTGQSFQLVAKDADSGGRAYTMDVTRSDSTPSVAGIRWYVNGGGTANTWVIEGRQPVANDERWVCGTFTPSTAGGLKLYVDGVLAATNAGTTDASIPTATTAAMIGRRGYAGFTEPLDGWVGDVRVYARALAADEVAELYRQHRRGYPDLLRRVRPVSRGFTPSGGGNQTLTPAVGSATGGAADPTLTPGAVALTSAAGSGAGAGSAPTVTPGSLSLTPAAGSGAGGAADPTLTPGAVSLTSAAGSATAAGVDPTLGTGGVLTPAVGTAAGSGADPTLTPGAVTLAPAVGSASGAGVDPAVLQGTVLTAGTGTAAGGGVNPTLTPGARTITVPAGSAAGGGANPTISGGGEPESPAGGVFGSGVFRSRVFGLAV